MLKNRIALTFLTLLFCSAAIHGQYNLQDYKKKYPGNNFIGLDRTEIVKMDIFGDQIRTVINVNEDFLILNKEGATLFSEEEIEYSSFEKISKIEAYSYQLEDKSKKKTKATNFVTKAAEKDDNVFHDDIQRISFFYPGLGEGFVKHLNYNMEVNEKHFPSGLRFYSFYPQEKIVFTIDHDTAIHLSKFEYNFENFEIVFTENIIKNRRIWTWTCTSVPNFRLDNYAPKPDYYLPGVFCQISHFYVKGVKTEVLGGLDNLVEWYSSNVQQAENEVPSEQLVNMTNALVEGLDDDLSRVKVIYYWVQDNIKYIAFEEGIGGFVPRTPNQVFDKKFGDCKDMSVLIYKMLGILNINAKLVWIGTDDIPFRYSDFPSSLVDNHMIAACNIDGTTYFLDATSELLPIYFPSSFTQGKEALVYSSRNDYKLEMVPVPEENKTKFTNKSRIEIQNRTITGTAIQKLEGYYNWLVRSKLIYMNDLTEEKKAERFSNMGNNSYKVTQAKFTIPENREMPMELDYSFKVDNYVTSYEDEIFVNLVLDKSIYIEKQLKNSRKSPFVMNFFSDNTYETELVIPDGMTVKNIPESIEYESEKVKFNIDYKIEENLVKVKIRTIFRFLLLQPDEFNIWNEFVSTVDKALNSSVVLIKNK